MTSKGILTTLELEILERKARGDMNVDIAEELFISLSTVENRMARARRKLGARTALHAVCRAYQLGLMKPPDSLAMEDEDVELVVHDNTAQRFVDSLHPRVIDVLKLMAQGYNNQYIAGDIGISLHTVEHHINLIFSEFEAEYDSNNTSRRTRVVLAYISTLDDIERGKFLCSNHNKRGDTRR